MDGPASPLASPPAGPPPAGRALDRRSFLGGLLTLVCTAPLAGVACSGDDDRPSPAVASDAGPDTPFGNWLVPAGTTLAPAQYALLSAAMDAMIPGDEGSPGAILCGAPWYLDQLLGAFASDPPRIFAGGPYSGRHGGVDGFSHFTPLTRVERIRWQTYLEGSRGIAEREFNGPVIGLRETYEKALDALDAAARALSTDGKGDPFTLQDQPTRVALLQSADETFVQMLYEHTVEGTYGDPVYGGNHDMKGWGAIRYEGDRQPLGYTAAQMLHPENG
jgi:gluconate 2-dehydrogenase gamma chain